MTAKPQIDAEYSFYNEQSQTKTIVRECPGAPGLTEILQREPNMEDLRLTITDDELPAMIEALRRRYADVVRAAEEKS